MPDKPNANGINALLPALTTQVQQAGDVAEENIDEVLTAMELTAQQQENSFARIDQSLQQLEEIAANPLSSGIRSIWDERYDPLYHRQKIQREQFHVQNAQRRLEQMTNLNQLETEQATLPVKESLQMIEAQTKAQNYSLIRTQLASAGIKLEESLGVRELMDADLDTIMKAAREKNPGLLGSNVSLGQIRGYLTEQQKASDQARAAAALRKSNELQYATDIEERLLQQATLPQLRYALAQAKQNNTSQVRLHDIPYPMHKVRARFTELQQARHDEDTKLAELYNNLTGYESAAREARYKLQNLANFENQALVATAADGGDELSSPFGDFDPSVLPVELQAEVQRASALVQAANESNMDPSVRTQVVTQQLQKVNEIVDSYIDSQTEDLPKEAKPAIKQFYTSRNGTVSNAAAAQSHVLSFLGAPAAMVDSPILSAAWESTQINMAAAVDTSIDFSKLDQDEVGDAILQAAFQDKSATEKDILLRNALTEKDPRNGMAPIDTFASMHAQQVLIQALTALQADAPDLFGGFVQDGRPTELMERDGYISPVAVLTELRQRIDNYNQAEGRTGKRMDKRALSGQLFSKVQSVLQAYSASMVDRHATPEAASFARILHGNRGRTVIDRQLNSWFSSEMQQQVDALFKQPPSRNEQLRNLMIHPSQRIE